MCFLLLTTSPLSPPSFTFRNNGRGLLRFCFPPGSLTEDYWPWLVASLRLWEREWPEGHARMSRNPLRGSHCVGAGEGLLLGWNDRSEGVLAQAASGGLEGRKEVWVSLSPSGHLGAPSFVSPVLLGDLWLGKEPWGLGCSLYFSSTLLFASGKHQFPAWKDVSSGPKCRKMWEFSGSPAKRNPPGPSPLWSYPFVVKRPEDILVLASSSVVREGGEKENIVRKSTYGPRPITASHLLWERLFVRWGQVTFGSWHTCVALEIALLPSFGLELQLLWAVPCGFRLHCGDGANSSLDHMSLWLEVGLVGGMAHLKVQLRIWGSSCFWGSPWPGGNGSHSPYPAAGWFGEESWCISELPVGSAFVAMTATSISSPMYNPP